MKILHCADMHMDSPFDALTEEQAIVRRGEMRGLLERLCELCQEKEVQLLLMAGDLLDSAASYYETQSALAQAFEQIRAEIFIAPGNHDYYCLKSPYAYIEFPKNVHIFKSPEIECVELEELSCKVWGAGFTAPHSGSLLKGFKAPDSDMLNIMVLHGDTQGETYNHISQSDIEDSNLDYLALGHIHTFSGIKKAGKTFYAYPGCPEGRGFDETGEKGVILGDLSKGSAELDFVKLCGREYRILELDLSGEEDVHSAIESAIGGEYKKDICRIVLTGEYDGKLDCDKLADAFSEKFFSVTVKSRVKPRRDIWSESGEDTLKGLFLSNLQTELDSDGENKDKIMLAARYGLAALENAEEWRL